MWRSVLVIVLTLDYYVLSKPNSQVNSLWNLNEMSECRLSYTALVYNNYGCWCGVGGAGKPIDGIDNCCKNHDKCYDAAITDKDCYDVPIEYIENYSWVCKRIEDAKPDPECTETTNKCKRAMCHCDKTVVDCWSQFEKPADKKHCTKRSLIKAFFSALKKIHLNF